MITEIRAEILGIVPNKRNNKIDLIIKPYGHLEKIKCTCIDENVKRRLHLYQVGNVAKIRFKLEAKPYNGHWTNYCTLMEII